jgi:Na+/alanine symporter
MLRAIITTIVILASLYGCLWAQEAEYVEMEIAENPPAMNSLGQRVPLAGIVVIILAFSIILHYYILNKAFIKYLEKEHSPESAAASCMIKWLAWVGVLALVFVGMDILNIDFYNIGEHFARSAVRIIVVVVLWVVAYLIISPHKRSQEFKGGKNG